ncbi:MAG: anti-sigma factor domain-containing protein, partial [Fidelibacterota bacterium]
MKHRSSIPTFSGGFTMLGRFLLIGIAPLMFVSGCGDDSPTTPAPGTTLVLTFSRVEPLGDGFHYEGWVIIDGEPVSAGKFNVSTDRDLVDMENRPIQGGEFRTGRDLTGASAILITIEPGGEDDDEPAGTRYLAGAVVNASATLTVGDSAALGNDFSGAEGRYVLATPTDDNTANENSGVWFLDLFPGIPFPGLELPDLHSGWTYEGWVVVEGMEVTTGTFTDVDDADLSSPFSGDYSGPPFPGEDFLVNPPGGLTFPFDLAGATVFISVEPSPDDDPGPFALRPLKGEIPGDATDHVTYVMENNSSGFPMGTATIR